MLNSVLAMVLVDIFDVNRGGGGGSVKMPSCLTCRALREKELS